MFGCESEDAARASLSRLARSFSSSRPLEQNLSATRRPNVRSSAAKFLVVAAAGAELERHAASQCEVLGFIHHTHSAFAQLGDDAVMSDGCADHRASISILNRGAGLQSCGRRPRRPLW